MKNKNNIEILELFLNKKTITVLKQDILMQSIVNNYNTNDIDNQQLIRYLKLKNLNLKNIKKLISIIELISRFKKNKNIKISSSKDIYKLNYYMVNFENEILKVIYMDNKNEIIHEQIISIGTNNKIIVNIKTIFQKAIITNANSIILCHNHISGDITPSNEDIEFTRNIQKICKFLNIKLLDHIIIGKQDYYSFNDNNKLKY